jgi:hypothetical protein
MEHTGAVAAQARNYVYHLTPSVNLLSIAKDGLHPMPKSGRFGYMSKEAYDGKAKLFLLPVLNGSAMNGFIQEWWYYVMRPNFMSSVVRIRTALWINQVRERYANNDNV